ncbi:FAD-dependent oxidoreductase domain-containing protein 1-like [Dreissena polymorpha]|uniref:FAD-dependent oxidoreductase domain-containing protein 1-like n=1 Tax=Dreissena polymorpha TaxID=45954 RepID=UPI002263B1A6|nr:FAD-dependent oxidoreductase domain-containing protein 1-like [Dreissena polymorpha]
MLQAFARRAPSISVRARCLCTKPPTSPGPPEREYVQPSTEEKSALKILKDEFRPLFTGEAVGVEKAVPRRTDVLIIGGGLVGTAAAYFLKAHGEMFDVTIVERDYGYTRASTMLSCGGVRHQFTIPENVQMSMFTTEFLKHYKEHLTVLGQDPPHVDFHHQGYLFLAPENRAQLLLDCVKMQRAQGAKTVILSKAQLAEKYPWMNLDGIECASYGTEGEGWFDPWQLVHALKGKNIQLGVRYCQGEVVKFRYDSVPLYTSGGIAEKKRILGVDVDHPDGKRYGCDAAVIINSAGPWAGEVARMAGIGVDVFPELPVEPRKRYVYTVHCPDGPTLDCPFLIDTSGAYIRREGLGGNYICGASPSEEAEPSIANLDVDYEFYQEVVWPSIAHRVPAFNNSKLKCAWAGYYDYNTVDQNLIIGSHPEYRNFLFANGMSGHGVQQGLAIGRALFEYIYYSKYKTIDLSMFDFARFAERRPILEQAIV